MALPTKLSKWPDELDWPDKLWKGGWNGKGDASHISDRTCCVSMWCVKVLGGTSKEIYYAASAPNNAMLRLGVPREVAGQATMLNDSHGFNDRTTGPMKAWRYLIGKLGYEEVTE